MKNFTLLTLALIFALISSAQTPKITWGEEFKWHKGSTDLEVIYSDRSGVYLQEGHMALKTYFVLGATSRESATLIKLDKNLNEVFHNDFNRELKGKEFVELFVVQDQLFLFASEYNRRDKTLDIFGAQIDKNSGEMTGDWIPVVQLQKEEKRDEINFKISYNADSTNIVIVSTVEGRERNEYKIQEFNKSLKALSKPIDISNEFDPKTFQLEDVLYTSNKKIILVGRMYEYEEGKKKKDKFLDFTNYNVRFYDERGKQQAEINTSVNGKWLMSTKIIQEKNKDLILAAFYSNSRKAKDINGLLVQRISPLTGDVMATSQKEINNALLSNDSDDNPDDAEDEKESKAERREREKLEKIKDEGEAFSKYMKFRNIFYTSDNGLVILAENYHQFYKVVTDESPGVNGLGAHYSSKTYSVHECGDLMMCKIDEGGNIGWLQVLPKFQREAVAVYVNYGTMFGSPYFDDSHLPFYAGFGTIQTNDNIFIIFNDNPRNAVVTQPGQKRKITTRFNKSDCFLVTLDGLTGKYNRKMFFSNRDVPTAMPRLGSPVENGMYLVGKEDHTLARTRIAVARITITK